MIEANMITLFILCLLMSHYAIAYHESEEENIRTLGWLGEVRTNIPISPFSLILSPTSRSLSEYEVSQVRSVLQDHILSKYQESSDPLMNFATSVELTGVITLWKPNNQIVQPHTIVSVEGGIAEYPFNIYQRAPTLAELHAFTMSILEQGLAVALRNVSGLRVVTSVEALPYQAITASPTKSPTIAPTKAPTIAPTKAPTIAPTPLPTKEPTKKPSKQPTAMPSRHPTKKPTRHPTRGPTRYPTKEPTLSPTQSPTKHPIYHPISEPTISPQQQQQQQQSVQAPTNSFNGMGTESILNNSETMQNIESSTTSWYPIVGAIGGVTLIVGAILVIRRKKNKKYLSTATQDFSDLDGPNLGSPGKKVAPAYVPSDSEDDVSEFSNVFPIGISPLLPDLEDRYLDTDSLNDDIDFPQVPFHQDDESFGSTKFF
jgi:LPXTG-motif cell wall-anchored protein